MFALLLKVKVTASKRQPRHVNYYLKASLRLVLYIHENYLCWSYSFSQMIRSIHRCIFAHYVNPTNMHAKRKKRGKGKRKTGCWYQRDRNARD
ncbi:hypothetical protein EYC80_010030 [Monilinia laxa]|uniref:Uncharacterized protein n=1 Tax=Monilinia laxa TaxID=61186 RepID=A0A5N6JU98_MONLA|nr:hypothetical protein EYC80_010030 [Monilinia laxa]